MKKFLSLLAAVLLMASVSEARAEGFLITGGLTFQSFSSATAQLQDLSVKGYTSWKAGLGYQTPSLAGFALQPELLYKAKGVKVSDEEQDASISMSYLELPVNIQWGIELFAFKPFIFASPYVGLNLGNKVTGTKELGQIVTEIAKKFEYGLGLGLGLDIAFFQVTAKYNWDFGGLASWKEYWEDVKDIKMSEGMFEVGIAFKF